MKKIPFDLRYKPEIESGKYKVQTTDGREVRIICWDKRVYGGRHEIVALVPTPEGSTEACQMYNPDGTLIASTWNDKFKLVILTDEPELTEFKTHLKWLMENGGTGPEHIKTGAKELLDLAKKELCNGCTKCLDEYWRGRKEASEEASRVFHYEGPTIPIYFPPCYYGGPCTNPQHDCINCPKKSTYTYTGPHIDTYISGKSDSSVTDGKEHPNSAIE